MAQRLPDTFSVSSWVTLTLENPVELVSLPHPSKTRTARPRVATQRSQHRIVRSSPDCFEQSRLDLLPARGRSHRAGDAASEGRHPVAVRLGAARPSPTSCPNVEQAV